MMIIENLKTKFDNAKKIITKKQAENEVIKSHIQENIDAIIELTKELEVGQEALQFVEDVANSRRGTMSNQIESIITEALQSIYGLEYSVELVYNVKNNRSHLDIIVVKDTENGKIKRDISGFGGGVADTVSMPLRLLVLLACKQTDKICLLDECFKHMDDHRIEFVAEFLKKICDKLGIQIIMCSHHELLKEAANNAYMISDKDGKAVVREII